MVFTKKTHNQVPLLERKIPKMKDIRITEGDVLKLLQGLNISKARGPDEISPKIYITDTCWQLSNLQVVYFYPLSVGKSVS
jgi:hypothetical protein